MKMPVKLEVGHESGVGLLGEAVFVRSDVCNVQYLWPGVIVDVRVLHPDDVWYGILAFTDRGARNMLCQRARTSSLVELPSGQFVMRAGVLP